MDFLDKRVKGICDELNKLKIKQTIPIEMWEYKEDDFVCPEDAAQAGDLWKKFDSRTMHWYGTDKHYWFKTTLTVPEEMQDKRMWMYVSTQIDEWDDGKNPQFLLFINGAPVQGIDMNHREVLLRQAAVSGESLTLELQAYTGILHFWSY